VPSVSVLYVVDDKIGPHLELLRRVTEPGSSSRPHITIRYFDKLSVPKNYLTTQVDYIDLMGPGSFGLADEWIQSNRTIYLRCESDQLVALEHKPHFPTSFFHITLYDGASLEFAKALLDILNRFEWRIRVPLPKGTRLSQIELKSPKSRAPVRWKPYPPYITSLFEDITSTKLTRSFINGLSDRERLKITNLICERLHLKAADFERVAATSVKTDLRSEGLESTGNEVDVHLTPPELAQEVTQYAVGLLPAKAEIHFGDPAVGNGAFYGALLGAVPRDRISSAMGIDINKQQVAAARSRWVHRGMTVKLGDYLHMAKEAPRNLILANPPYLRHQHIPASYKLSLRERSSAELGLKVSGMAGLYVYFLLLAHRWMTRDAIAGWLIPSEFMQTNYGKALRYYLTHKVQLLRVHRFDPTEPQFERVDVLPSVVVFKNRKPIATDEALFSLGGKLTSPVQLRSIPVSDLPIDSAWRFPSAVDPKFKPSKYCIGDLFNVRRGIATGANNFFILKRDQAKKLKLPNAVLRPILPKARLLMGDVVERAADGYPDVEPQLCLIDCDLPEDKIRSKYPTLAEYLGRARQEGLLKRNLLKNRRPWYRQEQRLPARFLCTYMGRGRQGVPPIRIIWNKSDAIAANTYLMLYTRPLLSRLLLKEPSLEAEVFGLMQKTALISMRSKWRIHAGGLVKIEPKGLLRVPLATTPDWIPSIIDSCFCN